MYLLSILITICQFVSAEEYLQSGCNKAKPSPTSTSVYVAPAPEYVAPPSSSYIAPPPSPNTGPEFTDVTSATVVGSSTHFSDSSVGLCLSEFPCSGDITYDEAGLGACGVTTDGSVEKVIALPVSLMGAQSNGNPYCGKTVTIKKGSKTTTATVVDKCMGREGNSIDLSNAAPPELADLSVGRTTAEWWFN
ncbi:hypothetical protein IFR05_016010 [Cadophora sp. M221]|nr:hypothetical protein IFR05_016010 [Cadophora sp. M221]